MRGRIQRAIDKFRGPNAWRAWGGVILLLLLVAYVLYIFTRGGIPELDLRELLARVRPGDLAVAVLLYGVSLVFAVTVWTLIIGMLSGCWLLVEHARIYCITSLTRRLPGTLWYMLGRVVLYERLGVSRGLIIVAGGLEFVTMVLGGLLVTLATWPFMLGGRVLSTPVVVGTVLLCALLLNPPLVRALIRRFGRGAGAPPVRYRHVLLWTSIFALIWCVGGVLLFAVARAVTPIPLASLPAVVGVWAVAGVTSTVFFSFLPFGLGATELTLASLLSPFVPPAEAFVIAVIMRVVLTFSEIVYGLLGGLLYLPDFLARRGPFTPDVEEEPHQDAVDSEEVYKPAAGLPPK